MALVQQLHAYWRLMRFDKPIGILLLWWPTAWGLCLAQAGHVRFLFWVYFLAGTVCMRAAGCVVNDIVDRHIDKHVTRTCQRPLTQGIVSLTEAFILLLILLCCALAIVIQLPIQCMYWACGALGVTVLYPWCKRFFQAPQCILGLAFSMGIPMAYAAMGHEITGVTILLLLINFLWIVAYDTEYAMVDKPDDLLIGVKSTAILFGQYDRFVIGCMQVLIQILWSILAVYLHWSVWFWLGWFLGSLNLIYQQWLLAENACFNAFLTNAWYGAFLTLAVIFN